MFVNSLRMPMMVLIVMSFRVKFYFNKEWMVCRLVDHIFDYITINIETKNLNNQDLK
jgi:hypothetical protein